jgi:hypothetical protein
MHNQQEQPQLLHLATETSKRMRELALRSSSRTFERTSHSQTPQIWKI